MFRALEDFRTESEPTFELIGPDGESVKVPESALVLLERLFEVLARGDATTLVPVHKELTTQQAADMLNISRQYLVRLLDDGEIPFHRTGTHRRIRFDDLVTYKRGRDKERLDSLGELTRLSEKFGGYDELS